jgi:exopolyphosphatase/guanosine-5'-triphosphate,3'-diphosphate pyrophosphatase
MKNLGLNLVAAIDIGSNYIRMCIAEISETGEISIIEDLLKSTDIGKVTFSKGKISVETINKTCETIYGFLHTLKEYKIKNLIAVSTTGLREAKNQDYVIEQIRLKTGIELKVINIAQERFFMYKALRDKTYNLEFMNTKPTLIVNITSGGVEISIYVKGNLILTEYIKIGSLRLREQLSALENITFDFPELMKEFIESKIQSLKDIIIDAKIEYFIGLGGELNIITSLCNTKDKPSKDHFISRNKIEGLYNNLIKMTSEQIIERYGISRKQEEILLPSIIFFKVFLEYTQAEGIETPKISLKHGLLRHMYEKNLESKNNIENKNSDEFNNDIMKSVFYIASKYNVHNKHSNFVKNIALSIFDQTLKLHCLNKKERLYLEVAAILHDVGKYVSFSDHELHSYNIIRTQNITGFSNEELRIIANITRYHETEIPEPSDENFSSLSFKDRILVSKLAAILQLAESLDVSHKQKIKKIEITLSANNIYFTPISKENILLEQWYFTNTAEFFEEIFALKPIMKYKG